MLKAFFGGLGISGYIITGLLTITVGLSGTMWLMSRNIDGLHEEIGEYRQAVNTMLATNLQNNQVIDLLRDELARCATMRVAADNRAKEATQELSKTKRETYVESTERKIEADANTPASSCIDPIPPRTTELLVEAANSANRGKDGS